MRYLDEFKSFALKGNVLDLAIGVVVGGAFGTIVNSLVADIIMPIVGALTGSIDLTRLVVSFSAVEIRYGKFLQSTVSFLIIAWSLFVVVKAINRFKKKEEEKPAAQQVVPEDIKLLSEIRDILRGCSQEKK